MKVQAPSVGRLLLAVAVGSAAAAIATLFAATGNLSVSMAAGGMLALAPVNIVCAWLLSSGVARPSRWVVPSVSGHVVWAFAAVGAAVSFVVPGGSHRLLMAALVLSGVGGVLHRLVQRRAVGAAHG